MSQLNPENLDDDVFSSKEQKLMSRQRLGTRKRAKAVLGKANPDVARLPPQDIQQLISELQVHQLELELQNEELNWAYQELTASRERYARLYNSGTVGYITLSEEGLIQHANQSAAKLLDCPLELLASKKLGDFIHPADQEAYHIFFQAFATQDPDKILTVRLNDHKKLDRSLQCPGPRLSNCMQATCKESQQFTVVELRHAINYFNVNDRHICLAINDITERILAQESIACLNEKLEQKIANQAQELVESNQKLQKKIDELHHSKDQLEEREAKLNAIFNAAIEGIITVDTSGIIVSVNSAIETIFGYRQEELIGCSIIKLMPTEIQTKRDTYMQTRMPDMLSRIRSIDGMRKDGVLVPVDISVAEFSIDGAKYYASIVRDVSSRRLKELEDKAHLDELAHVTRLGLMGEMASGIAHEVNQPLTAIASYTQACLNFMQAEQPDLLQLREVLQKTYQQALKAGQIIHRMREFVTSKTTHRSSVVINDLINVCLSLCAADLKHNNIVQKINLAKNIPVVYVDSVQIEQVLLNLIKNSLDALKNLPENKQQLLSIQTSQDDHHRIVVRIKDNGPGIEKTEQEKILTPFFTTKKSGMGMGLSISQSLVKANGGELFFNSEPGKGTTFYFTLPVQEQ